MWHDLNSALHDGALNEATLRLMIVNLTSLDMLRFKLNGKLLDSTSAKRRLLYNDCWIDLDVLPPLLKQGWNHLNVKMKSRNPHISAPLRLKNVEVIVRYNQLA